MVERVVIAIPTCKRPNSLARLLDAIAALDTDAEISVLVADNDAEAHQGFDLCEGLTTSYRWPLKAVIEPMRGIAPARNRLVSEALKSDAQFIAMIDDDEWPVPDWIARFLETQVQTGADVLQGSILFVRDKAGPEPVPDIRHPTGPVDMLQGAGNLLICRQVLEQTAAPWFDPAFALTGGEDLEFFMRLKRAGYRFGWADDARALGETASLRHDLGWVMRRAYSNGNSDMRVLLKYRQGFTTIAVESLKIAGALLLSLPLAIILGLSPNHRRAPLVTFSRAAGKLTAMMGVRYNEYALVHGE
ncbi:MAG: glycosyltransferase family A protein [Rhizomicrobium sp.]